MSVIVDLLRPYWARGLNDVAGHPRLGIADFLASETNYQVYNNLKKDEFEVTVADSLFLLESLGFDCNRFSTAAFETALDCMRSRLHKKSLGWVIVQQYYSAFYSGHFVLRVFGISISQLSGTVARAIENVADIFGCKNGVKLEEGLYSLDFSRNPMQLIGQKKAISGDGSHVAMWTKLSELLRRLSLTVLSDGSATYRQSVSDLLSTCCKNLNHAGANGSWLSRIRNEANYKLSGGLWYPYLGREAYYDDIERMLAMWESDPIEIKLDIYPHKQYLKFIATCQFLIGLAKAIALDMGLRCSKGKSYLHVGPIALINQYKGKVKYSPN